MSSTEVVLVTGANTGLGYETIKALLQSPKPYHVLMGSRNVAKGEAAVESLRNEVPQTSSQVEVIQIDVSDDSSIEKAFNHIEKKIGRLDILVNNAGASFDGKFVQDAPKARDVFNRNFNTNVSGAHVVTLAAAPLLIASPAGRLIFLTSGLATLTGNATTLFPPFAPNPSGGWPKDDLMIQPGYRTSKAAVNMLMLTWHWLLKEDGVKTFSISPGFLATNLGGAGPEKLQSAGAQDPSMGGDVVRSVIAGERDEDAGKVVWVDGKVQDW